MHAHVLLTTDPIDQALRELPLPWNVGSDRPAGSTRALANLEGPVGAWLDFYGIVRDLESVRAIESADAPQAQTESAGAPPGPQVERIVAIEYEAHPEMALHQLERLVERIGAKYAVHAMLVIHRIGRVPVAEPSLLVRILSGHRGESLRACAEFIDDLKKWIPIWKHPISA